MEVGMRRKSLPSLTRRSHRRNAISSEESPGFHLVGYQQTLASALLDCCLVTWLKNSALGLWLCESATQLMDSRVVSWLTSTPQAKLFRLLFWTILCLLLVWLLSDLHLGLPCFLLGLFYWIYNGPVMRGMSQAWVQWRAVVRTPTEQVLFGWWVILSTAVTLTWWWCVSVCCAGLSGSVTAVLLEFLNTSASLLD